MLLLLLAGSLTLLVIAIVNVAILMTGEVSSRNHEMATRVAVGARIPRLVRQLLTESLVLGAAGSALGALIAGLAVNFTGPGCGIQQPFSGNRGTVSFRQPGFWMG